MMKKSFYLLLLPFIFFFHLIVNYTVMDRSEVARIYDEDNRISAGFSYSRLFFYKPHLSLSEKLKPVFLLDSRQAHPHFYEVVESFFWGIAQEFRMPDEDIVILSTNMFFFLILLLSVYGIGSLLFDNMTGLLSSLLVSIFPLVFGHARIAMLDYPLMCMVALSFYLLIKTDWFSSLFYSVLFGLSCGLSQLTKEAAVFFLFAPFIYYVVHSYSGNQNRRALLNSAIAFFVFIVVAGSVYLQISNFHAYGTYLGKSSLPFPAIARNYFNEFYKMTGFFVFVLSLPIMLSSLINFKKRDKLLFLWFIVPVLLFSVSPNRNIRFLLPVAPAFALILVHELFAGAFSRTIRYTYLSAFMCVSVMQYTLYNAGVLCPATVPEDTCIDTGQLSVRRDKNLSVVPGLLECFKKETAGLARDRTIISMFNIGEINCTLNRKLLFAQIPLHVLCPMQADEIEIRRSNRWKYPEEILCADYIMHKSGYRYGLGARLTSDIEDVIIKGFDKYKAYYRVIAVVKSNDGTSVVVYKKND